MAAKPIKKILWATDLSDQAEEAFHWAKALCKKTNSEILVRYSFPVIENPLVMPAIDEHFLKKAIEDRKTEVTDKLLSYVKDVRNEGLRANAKVIYGDPRKSIINEAKKERAGLISMGVRGVGLLESLLVGSTLTRVIHNSPVPVLAVPSQAGKPRFEKILVPLDLTRTSLKAFKFAVRISEFTSSSITVLHIIETGDVELPGDILEKIEKKAIRHIERGLGRNIRDMNKKVEIELRVSRTRDVAKEIIDFAETGDFSMIFLSPYTKRKIFKILLGSVTERIIKHTFVPVCIVRG